MSNIRHVITGHGPNGEATVVADTRVEGITTALIPGMEFFRLWAIDKPPVVPFREDATPRGPYFPSPGGARFGVMTVPPDSEVNLSDEAHAAALEELENTLPGLLEHLEPDNPGMHTTDTVDLEYVVSGEIWLELDNGEEVHLKAGDTVAQNGTRHAWRNRSSAPCTIVWFLVGATRAEP